VYHLPIMSDSYQPPSTKLGPSGIALYSVQGIVIGTVLGSLAAGIAMLFLNYRALGKTNLATSVAIWGSAICIGVVLLTSLAPNTTELALLFMGLQAVIAFFLADRLQGAAISYHRQHAGTMHSSLRAAGIGFLAGMAIIFALLTLSILWAVITGVPAASSG